MKPSLTSAAWIRRTPAPLAPRPRSPPGSALPACSSDDSGAGQEPTPTPEGTAADVFTCQDDDFGASPFAGPGYDAAQGGLLGTPQASYITSVTLRP